jgi:chaperonin GroEL
MAGFMGEIFDIIGEYGVLDIRTGRSRESQREYVEGMYWPGSLLSRQFVTAADRGRAELENAAILISDIEVTDPRDLLFPLNAATKAGFKTMMLVAKSLPDLAVHLLTTAQTREKIQVIAAKTPYATLPAQAAALQDLAILTGGRPILGKAGQTLKDTRLEDLGRARRVWADRYNFGISGGQGDKRKLREHIANLRNAHYKIEDIQEQEKLQERIGKLLGGSATLWIGASTESELETKKELAKRTARALRGAVLEGMLPGGGAALLACRPALQARLAQSVASAERAAYRALLEATETPIRTLLANAGYEPSAILGDIYRAGPGYGFDLQSEQVVDMTEAGIFDVATVQRDAIRSAISSAALALTIETVVHRKQPQQSLEP